MDTPAAWESVFQDAVHESDPMLAEAKIRMAEAAIFDRIHEFSTSPGSLEEQALFDALGTIKVLRSVRRIPRATDITSDHVETSAASS